MAIKPREGLANINENASGGPLSGASASLRSVEEVAMPEGYFILSAVHNRSAPPAGGSRRGTSGKQARTRHGGTRWQNGTVRTLSRPWALAITSDIPRAEQSCSPRLSGCRCHWRSSPARTRARLYFPVNFARRSPSLARIRRAPVPPSRLQIPVNFAARWGTARIGRRHC